MSKFVKTQKIQIRKARKIDKGSYENSPYWNYLANLAYYNDDTLVEPKEANPDALGEDDGIYSVSDVRKAQILLVRRAVKLGKLSKRERQVLEMLMQTNKTHDEVAGILGISRQAVTMYYKRSLEKIETYIRREYDK